MKSSVDLTKITRWVIPGWIGFLSFFSFRIIDIIVATPQNESVILNITIFLNQITSATAIVSTLIIAAAGVPLGFSIYQIYFFFRWNSPFSRDGLFPPLISGRFNDLALTVRDIEMNDLATDKIWRKKWVDHPYFSRDHGFRWRYIELMFREAAQSIDSKYSSSSLLDRHHYLHEIVHTLGASFVAVGLGFFSYLVERSFDEAVYLSQHILITLLVILMLTFLLNREITATDWCKNYEGNDSNNPIPAFCWKLRIKKRPTQFCIVSPAALFIAFFGMVLFYSIPILKSQYIMEYLAKIAVGGVLVSSWLLSQRTHTKEFIFGDSITLVVSLLVAIILERILVSYQSEFDWSFLSSLFVFTTANFILLANRSNANKDLLALEYYTLRRYLSDINRKMD